MTDNNGKSGTKDLFQALESMAIVNETLSAVEKRIYWELDQLNQRLNPNDDTAIRNELQLYAADFLDTLSQKIKQAVPD